VFVNRPQSYKRWMPHVNLLYPFVPYEQFEKTAPLLSEALQSVKPFKVTLNTFGYFSHGKSSTLWLKPSVAVFFLVSSNNPQRREKK
jgi:poly(A) polymerase